VDARKVAVEHDHVVIGDRRLGECLAAVEGDVDRHPEPAQTRGNRESGLAWSSTNSTRVTLSSPLVASPKIAGGRSERESQDAESPVTKR
jgi:hypothetical protein